MDNRRLLIGRNYRVTCTRGAWRFAQAHPTREGETRWTPMSVRVSDAGLLLPFQGEGPYPGSALVFTILVRADLLPALSKQCTCGNLALLVCDDIPQLVLTSARDVWIQQVQFHAPALAHTTRAGVDTL